MNINHIENKFVAMGARLKMSVNRFRANDYAIDIQRDRRGEFFELRVPEAMTDDLEVTVLQAQPRERICYCSSENP